MPTAGSRWGELPARMAPAVEGDDQEAEEREEEGEVDCRHGADKAHVDDAGLERRHDGAAEDGHDEAGGANLDVFASDALERHAVDCRGHQRHARRHSHEAAQAHMASDQDDNKKQTSCDNCQNRKEFTRIQETKKEGAYEPAHAEQAHRHHIVLLRKYLRRLLAHTLAHEHIDAILDDERPAHDLHAHTTQ